MELRLSGEREVLISTGVNVPLSQWDGEAARKSYKGHQSINANLANQRRALEDLILKYQYEGKVITAKGIKEAFVNGSTGNSIKAYLETFCDRLKDKRSPVTIRKYGIHVGHFIDYVGNILMSDITDRHLTGYEGHLKRLKKADGSRRYTDTYVFMLIRMVRQLINDAIKRKVIAEDPFALYERPQYHAPKKDFLTFEELTKVEEFIHETKIKRYRIAAIYFLFGCYTGLRVSDWYNFGPQHIHNGFIELEAEKNKKPVNIPITPPLKRILGLIDRQPLSITEPRVNIYLKEIMAELKINKHITTHCGRHTFAVTLCLGMGVSSETAAKIMGITLQTFVDNYSQVTQDKITLETERAWKELK